MADPQHIADLQSSDLIIAVVGVSGSGRTHFISHFMSEGNKPTVKGLELGRQCSSTWMANPTLMPSSVSIKIEVYKCSTAEIPIFYLLDVPAFDYYDNTGRDIFKDISNMLSAVYSRNVLLSGVIYTHPITATRFSGSYVKNMKFWRQLCGEDYMSAVVLVTTMWGMFIDEARAVEVEKQLMSDDFWGVPLSQGSQIFRDDNKRVSAEKIISYLLQRRKKIVLAIQKQVVDDKMELEDTTAGLGIQANLNEQISICEKELEDLREEMDFASSRKDTNWQEKIQARITELEKKSTRLRKRNIV